MSVSPSSHLSASSIPQSALPSLCTLFLITTNTRNGTADSPRVRAKQNSRQGRHTALKLRHITTEWKAHWHVLRQGLPRHLQYYHILKSKKGLSFRNMCELGLTANFRSLKMTEVLSGDYTCQTNPGHRACSAIVVHAVCFPKSLFCPWACNPFI